MEANFSALSLAMNSAMGCWQVSHQHKPGCCNDRKRLSQSAGCSDEFWELSLCAYSILGSHTSLSSPLIRWPSTPGTKTLGMWAMQSCSSETPVQTTNTGVSLRLWASSEGLHPTPPWPRPPPCTQSLWAQIVKTRICFQIEARPGQTISWWQLSQTLFPHSLQFIHLWTRLPRKSRA